MNTNDHEYHMGYKVDYNEENDHIILTQDGKIIPDEHATEYETSKGYPWLFKKDHPQKVPPTDPIKLVQQRMTTIGNLEWVIFNSQRKKHTSNLTCVKHRMVTSWNFCQGDDDLTFIKVRVFKAGTGTPEETEKSL